MSNQRVLIAALLYFILPSMLAYGNTLEQQIQDVEQLKSHKKRVEAYLLIEQSFEQHDNLYVKSRNIAELYYRLAMAQRNSAQAEDAEATTNKLFYYARSSDLPRYLALASLEQGKLLRFKGLFEQSMIPLQQAYRQFVELDLPELQSETLRRQADAYRRMGEYDKAIELASKARKIASDHELQEEIGHTLGSLAMIYVDVGLYQEALELELQSLQYLPFNDSDINLRAGSYYAIGEKYRKLKQFDHAVDFFLKSYDLDKKLENPLHIGYSQIKLAESYLGQRNFERAMFYAQEGLKTYTDLKVPRYEATAQAAMGDVFLEQEQFQQSHTHLQRAFNTLQELDEKPLLSKVTLSLARVKLALGEVEIAYQYFNNVLAFSEKNNIHDNKLNALKYIIQIQQQKGDFAAALTAQQKLYEETFDYSEQLHSKRVSLLQNSVESVNKDAQIQILEAEHQLHQANITQEKAEYTIMVGLVLVLLTLLLALLYVIYSRRKLAAVKSQLLNESIERRNQLFTDVSHELRTPISVLKLQLEALEHNLVADKKLTFKKLHQKISELNNLIGDIYQLARLDSNTLKLEFTTLGCLEMMECCADDMDTYASEHQHNFHAQINIASEIQLRCDINRIKQVLMNLIRNSVKYTDAPGEINFIANIQSDYLYITLEDSTPSVSNDALNKIFDRLYREDGSRNRDSGGSGLGLAITKSIIELHNGTIAAHHSELGGLSVSIKLPLH